MAKPATAAGRVVPSFSHLLLLDKQVDKPYLVFDPQVVAAEYAGRKPAKFLLVLELGPGCHLFSVFVGSVQHDWGYGVRKVHPLLCSLLLSGGGQRKILLLANDDPTWCICLRSVGPGWAVQQISGRLCLPQMFLLGVHRRGQEVMVAESQPQGLASRFEGRR